jgi:ribonucleoside-diphosphate reductase beta chain
MLWLPEEVPLHRDVADWENKLSTNEKNLLTQIFRFFTQGDCDVAQGYYERYIPLFKKPELRMMLGSFANMEGIHQEAYSLLLDTVGMPEAEYSAFLSYEEMRDKHDYIMDFSIKQEANEGLPEGYYSNEFLESVAENIAVYSAFTEGLQLFGSFAILMNFARFNKMIGMTTIVEWSIRDESLHVEAMTKLFREFISEHPWIWTDEFKKKLYDTAREMVRLEDSFIDLAFEQGEIEGLKATEVKEYIRYICDRRLLQLGLKPNYGIKENPLGWLDWILNGDRQVNFFEQRSTDYAKAGALKGDIWV